MGERVAEAVNFTWRRFGLAILCVASAGCSTVGYYSQAVRGHCQIGARQKPIERVLADTNAPAQLKSQLRLVLDLREFAARELKLPVRRHYTRYADLGRRFVVWNVTATPEFSMESKSWWYPFVGRLKYRGYFDDAAARRFAASLTAGGFDADVGGVQAYSTLGWFSDPVLNTFVHDAEVELAELLFHELAHQRLFVSGDTDFSEAFAESVAEEGARRWLRAKGDPAALADYEARLRRKAQFTELITRARTRLAELYCPVATETPPLVKVSMLDEARTADLRHRKQALLDELCRDYVQLKSAWNGATDYDRWFARPLNNARLNDVDTYYGLVPAFHRLLAAKGGDLDAFFHEVESLSKLPQANRRASLESRGTSAGGSRP